MANRYFVRLLLAAAASAALPIAATAQERSAPAEESPFGVAKPIGNADLGTVTGRDELSQVVNARNASTVSGNSVTGNSQTGTIHFDSNSFQNLNGLSLLSANTGNNVSINSSLNVNVAISGR